MLTVAIANWMNSAEYLDNRYRRVRIQQDPPVPTRMRKYPWQLSMHVSNGIRFGLRWEALWRWVHRLFTFPLQILRGQSSPWFIMLITRWLCDFVGEWKKKGNKPSQKIAACSLFSSPPPPPFPHTPFPWTTSVDETDFSWSLFAFDISFCSRTKNIPYLHQLNKGIIFFLLFQKRRLSLRLRPHNVGRLFGN